MRIKAFFFLFLLPALALSLEMQLPVIYDGGLSPRTEVQREASYVAYDAIKSTGRNVYRLHSLANIGDERIWYVFSKDIHVYAVDISSGEVVGSWELMPYKDHLFLSGEYLAAAKLISEVRGEYLTMPEDSLSIVSDRLVIYSMDRDAESMNGIGCLQKSPFRYGDVTLDGYKELIFLLDGNLIVFSVVRGEVIFSAHYWMVDELSATRLEIDFPGAPEVGDPVFIAESGADVLVRRKIPAWRSASKFYFGDLDEDGRQDIVVWRKLYTSKINDGESQGFNANGQLLVHYKLNEGKYELQDTPAPTIRGWLLAGDLTWSDGFPAYSECLGEEGELIPEMHDPLLNDPDILQ